MRDSNIYIKSKVHLFLLWFLCFFSFCVIAEETNSSSDEEDLEKEELQVQESFPQYKVDFYHKAVQEEVYNELLKELKDKEKSD